MEIIKANGRGAAEGSWVLAGEELSLIFSIWNKKLSFNTLIHTINFIDLYIIFMKKQLCQRKALFNVLAGDRRVMISNNNNDEQWWQSRARKWQVHITIESGSSLFAISSTGRPKSAQPSATTFKHSHRFNFPFRLLLSKTHTYFMLSIIKIRELY